MKYFRKLFVTFAVLTLVISSLVTGASANPSSDVHVLIESDFQTRGPSAPTGDPYNLALSSYNYQVVSLSSNVYTDKLLKGATNMRVSLSNWNIPVNHGAPNSQVTITLVDSNGFSASKTITGLAIGDSDYVDFTGLNSSLNYYVKFTVPINGNSYSFNGSISKV